MPEQAEDAEIDVEIDAEQQDQVLHREALEEDLMQQGRSDEGETIDGVETGEATP